MVQYKLTPALYLSISKWQLDTASDKDIQDIFNYQREYLNAIINGKAYNRYLVNSQDITDGDFWVYISSLKGRYKKDKSSYSTWLYNQIWAYLRQKNRADIKEKYQKQLDQDTQDWAIKEKLCQDFDYSEIENVRDKDNEDK